MTRLLNLVEKRRKYQTLWVEDFPENPERDTVYIIGGREQPYHAAVVCPRRKCKQVVRLEISSEHKTKWKLHEHRDGSVSLSPSIHVTSFPCRCHYWVRHGRIIWADSPPVFVPKKNRERHRKRNPRRLWP